MTLRGHIYWRKDNTTSPKWRLFLVNAANIQWFFWYRWSETYWFVWSGKKHGDVTERLLYRMIKSNAGGQTANKSLTMVSSSRHCVSLLLHYIIMNIYIHHRFLARYAVCQKLSWNLLILNQFPWIPHHGCCRQGNILQWDYVSLFSVLQQVCAFWCIWGFHQKLSVDNLASYLGYHLMFCCHGFSVAMVTKVCVFSWSAMDCHEASCRWSGSQDIFFLAPW